MPADLIKAEVFPIYKVFMLLQKFLCLIDLHFTLSVTVLELRVKCFPMWLFNVLTVGFNVKITV